MKNPFAKKPDNQENIRNKDGRYKKGFSGNPAGRPKLGLTLSEMVRDALAEAVEGDYTKRDELLDIAIAKAKKGDYRYFDWLFARGFGKVPDVISLHQSTTEVDFSKLTAEELEAYETILNKLGGTEEES